MNCCALTTILYLDFDDTNAIVECFPLIHEQISRNSTIKNYTSDLKVSACALNFDKKIEKK